MKIETTKIQSPSSSRAFGKVNSYSVRGSRKVRDMIRRMAQDGHGQIEASAKEMGQAGLISESTDETVFVWIPWCSFSPRKKRDILEFIPYQNV